ncbi:uncharacterized protein LOC119646433 isoform X1 [Hermetia illucens]|nr:uncharacterized protein LOC119646433 isoform X1 [Hermetia illucens]
MVGIMACTFETYKMPDGNDLKRYGEKWWCKKSTGASRWKGGYNDRMYIRDYGSAEDNDKGIGRGHRRRHLASSDHDKTWWSFDLDKCYRIDVVFNAMNKCEWYNYEAMGPTITLDKLKAKELETDEQWNDSRFEASYMQSTPHYHPYVRHIGRTYIGSDFGWLYRTHLQHFFMVRGIEQYSIKNGITPDWHVQENDWVWSPDKTPPNLPAPVVPYPPDDQHAVPDDPNKPLPPPPPPPAPVDVVVGDVALLIPLLDMARTDLTETLDDLKKCVESRGNMAKKKIAACGKYNTALEQSLNAAANKYSSRVSYLELLSKECGETLKILCTKYAEGGLVIRPEQQDVQANIRRINTQGNFFHIKEVSGRLPPLTNMQNRADRSAQQTLQSLINQMKVICRMEEN